jgi:asparagine synthase (glutamine-hydrolysing)
MARAAFAATAMDEDSCWRRVVTEDGLWIWTTVRDPPEVRLLPEESGVVVGRLHAMPGATSDHPATLSGHEGLPTRARELSRSCWGAYVAILRAGGSGAAGIYRDPSAGLGALTWSLDEGVDLVASHVAPFPIGVGPRRPFMNWDRIAEFIASPPASMSASLFDDVTVVGPGDMVTLDTPHRTTSIWSPVAFARDPIDDPQAAAAGLRASVDHAVTATISGYDRVLLEVSGGLDSSIIAGTVAANSQTARVAGAMNFAYGRLESDESDYARAVADRIGVRLTTFSHAPQALDEAAVSEMSDAFLPAANSVLPWVDRDEVACVRATGAQAIVSGQGGDAVFFQMPSALVAGDAIAQEGWRALGSDIIADVARRTRMSVWDVVRTAHGQRRGLQAPDGMVSSLVTPDVGALAPRSSHSWMTQAQSEDLPCGKRLHVLAATIFFGNEGARQKREVADLLFPLFAQPVLEHCLRIPTPILAGGAYDRAFARQAFADRIPDIVLRRRAKGMVTAHFAKMLAMSLPFLRPFLLDGCLCAAGVLDRVALERSLDRDHLIWHAKPTDILWAVAVEAWVRHWQTRVPDSPSARPR